MTADPRDLATALRGHVCIRTGVDGLFFVKADESVLHAATFIDSTLPMWDAWQTADPPCTTCGGERIKPKVVSNEPCPACVDHPGVQPFTEWVAGVIAALTAPHADEHLIEFRNDGWTIQHPIAERLDGSMFDCPMANWDGGDIGYRGQYVLYQDDDGQLNIGAEVARQIGGIR